MRLSFILTISIFSHLSVNAQFKEGFIVDKYGQKFPGFINFVQGESLSYKEKKSSKKETLTINDLNAFVVETDSFISIRSFKVNARKTVSGFAKVLIRRPGKLLCSVSSYTTNRSTPMVTTWEATHYLVQTETKLFEITKYNFIKEMPSIVDDDPALKQKITSRELRYDDMEKIVSTYTSSKGRGK